MKKTVDPTFQTLIVVPIEFTRNSGFNNLISTPTLRIAVEGENVRGGRYGQVLISHGCSFLENEFKEWYADLSTTLAPNGRVIFL
jgi:hypothetical protein